MFYSHPSFGLYLQYPLGKHGWELESFRVYYKVFLCSMSQVSESETREIQLAKLLFRQEYPVLSCMGPLARVEAISVIPYLKSIKFSLNHVLWSTGRTGHSVWEMATETLLSKVRGLLMSSSSGWSCFCAQNRLAAFHSNEPLNVFKSKVSILSGSSPRKRLESVMI